MGTCEDDNNNHHPWALTRHNEEAELGFSWSASHTVISQSNLDVPDEALIQKFENVGLKSNDDDEHNDYGGLDDGRLHPLRPYAEDCSHYLRTGTCKFGLSCRFNHPAKRTNQGGSHEINEGFPTKTEQIECKYYLTEGGCKYGKSCRFNHSKAESEIVLPELNFLGLPIRSGTRKCPFYMRTGSCGYGARCRFHHPDPTSVGGSDSCNLTLNDESAGQFGHYSGNFNGESVPLHLLGASQPVQASWSSPMISDDVVPYLDNRSSYMPAKTLLPERLHQNREWSGYQVPDYAETNLPRSAPAANTYMEKPELSIKVKEPTERADMPDCVFFMKTGDCKFKSSCRYNHPKDRAPKPEVHVLNDKGLPLRPGKAICRYYESYGICKFGRACLYDHPATHGLSSTFPDGSQ